MIYNLQTEFQKLEINKWRFLVTFPDGKIVASLEVIADIKLDAVFFEIPLPTKHWIIEEIYVLPEFRGQKIGTSLLKNSLDKITEISPLPVIAVPPKGEYLNRIINWYKRHGFVFVEGNYYLVKESNGKSSCSKGC